MISVQFTMKMLIVNCVRNILGQTVLRNQSGFSSFSHVGKKIYDHHCKIRLGDSFKYFSSIQTQFLDLGNDRKIAYKSTEGDFKKPTVVYVPGLMNTMEEIKAITLNNFCESESVNLIRFDFEGIGESSGSLEKVYFGQWIEDLQHVVDKLCKSPVILVGFSMGGWISTSVAVQRPEKLHSLLFVAPGFNFLDHYYRLFYKKLSPKQQKDLDDGKCIYFNELFMRKDFAEESRKYHIDFEKTIPINVPIRIIHGVQDRDAPYIISMELLSYFESMDVDVYLRKSGKHQMVESSDLDLLTTTLKHLIYDYPVNKG